MQGFIVNSTFTSLHIPGTTRRDEMIPILQGFNWLQEKKSYSSRACEAEQESVRRIEPQKIPITSE